MNPERNILPQQNNEKRTVMTREQRALNQADYERALAATEEADIKAANELDIERHRNFGQATAEDPDSAEGLAHANELMASLKPQRPPKTIRPFSIPPTALSSVPPPPRVTTDELGSTKIIPPAPPLGGEEPSFHWEDNEKID